MLKRSKRRWLGVGLGAIALVVAFSGTAVAKPKAITNIQQVPQSGGE
jgi:hypothetical protein